ncbi:hypothetical protein OH76DRAFT_1405641 [Lentinus brumalis]|uniref:Uncharacterized protein n=1 Tax=Lentinus brumalis TaxID=2498619 RepID=A0A371D4X8_9APHY|nr:hypothetical protein OH76DRAFT_1405641 [Polyporus brumalis]
MNHCNVAPTEGHSTTTHQKRHSYIRNGHHTDIWADMPGSLLHSHRFSWPALLPSEELQRIAIAAQDASEPPCRTLPNAPSLPSISTPPPPTFCPRITTSSPLSSRALRLWAVHDLASSAGMVRAAHCPGVLEGDDVLSGPSARGGLWRTPRLDAVCLRRRCPQNC